MDWNKINLLLDIIHKSINVPGTDVIRAEAIKELGKVTFAEVKAEVEPELPLTTRRL